MSETTLKFLELVPRNALSRGVGGLLRGPWPKAVHQAALRWFVKQYGVAVDEAERPLDAYRTFNAFFTRRLKAGARPLAAGDDVLVSPSDGALGTFGPIERGTLLQAKGRPYDLEAFLGDADRARAYEGGTYVTIYLAPYDYHRVHFPVAGEVVAAQHLPGTLWPVNPPAVARIEDLFAVNERLVTHLETDAGPVAAVMVGATCVGRIRMLYDDGVTNAGRDLGRRTYRPPRPVQKGDELGVFEMGSTVVLLLGPGGWRLDEGLETGRKVRMGEALGRRVGARAAG
jgi:phosphatidylserine decarboxylase